MQFAHHLDVDNYNVKKYRKRNTSHTHRNHQKQQHAHHDSLHLIGPINAQKRDQSADKTPRTTEIVSSRRFSSTAGVKKRSQRVVDANQISFLNTARTKLPSSVVDCPSEFGVEEKDLATVKWNEPIRPPGKFVIKER